MDALTHLDDALGEMKSAMATAGIDPDEVSEETVQGLLTLGVKLYAMKAENAADPSTPFLAGSPSLEVTPTEGAVAADAILDAVGIELFELGMWQMWGRGRA